VAIIAAALALTLALAAASAGAAEVLVDRSFHRLAEGLVHLRSVAGSGAAGGPPVLLLHPSPSSSRTLEPLLREAEALALADQPVAPLHYMVGRRLVSPRVSGFADNPRGLYPSWLMTVTPR
jgi:pimeloyl-ACP methyl ester carboxylesterase